MILLRVNISEESGTLQVQRLSHADGTPTAREIELLKGFLAAMTRTMGEFSASIGGGEVMSTVHRRMEVLEGALPGEAPALPVSGPHLTPALSDHGSHLTPALSPSGEGETPAALNASPEAKSGEGGYVHGPSISNVCGGGAL